MDENEWLAERFEQHRPRLRAVAYQMLGSPAEADDAVQDAWLRLSQSKAEQIDNLGGWLTTVVARECLHMLRSRRYRREEPFTAGLPEPVITPDENLHPEQEALLADSVGLALLVVLDALAPAERVALVLHDVFAVPFEEIATILERSTPAARQLASRARRRVQSYGGGLQGTDEIRQAKLVEAFLAASRNGDLSALMSILDPDVVLRADEAAVKMGAAAETRGAQVVASLSRRARGARPALLNGAAGAVWMPGGRPRIVFSFTISGDKIIAIDLIARPEHLRQINVVVPEDH